MGGGQACFVSGSDRCPPGTAPGRARSPFGIPLRGLSAGRVAIPGDRRLRYLCPPHPVRDPGSAEDPTEARDSEAHPEVPSGCRRRVLRLCAPLSLQRQREDRGGAKPLRIPEPSHPGGHQLPAPDGPGGGHHRREAHQGGLHPLGTSSERGVAPLRTAQRIRACGGPSNPGSPGMEEPGGSPVLPGHGVLHAAPRGHGRSPPCVAGAIGGRGAVESWHGRSTFPG